MAREAKRRRLTRPYGDESEEGPSLPSQEGEIRREHAEAYKHIEEPELPEDADDDIGDLPNDTLAAVLLLRSHFPPVWNKDTAPLVLRSQIYSILKDRTIVDRQLDELRLENKLRVFKLLTLKDEYAYLLSDDYTALIDRIRQKQEGEVSEAAIQVLTLFPDRVLPRCPGIDISHSDLFKHLATDCRGRRTAATVTEVHASLLLNVGLLNRHPTAPDHYIFAIPNAGQVVKSILAGRKELLGMLGRRRHPEMFVKELLKKKLQGSALGIRWHVRDLLGSGALQQLDTTSGPLLRIVKRH